MSGPDDCATAVSSGEAVITITKDAYGHEHRLQVFTWRGQSLNHFLAFQSLPSVFESVQSYLPITGDVWTITFPRSGSNWLYEIVSILMSGDIRPVPTVMQDHAVELVKSLDDIHQMKTHRHFHTHLYPDLLPEAIYEGPSKVVSVIRNPLSMALSWYYLLTTAAGQSAEAWDMPYTGTAREYMLAIIYGSHPHFNEAALYNTWFQHAKAVWRKYKSHPENVHVVFYEDLKRNPLANIQAIGHFLGKDYPNETYQQIVELTSLDSLAKSSKNKASQILCVDDFKLFRKGQIDEWKDYLSEDDFKEFFSYFQDQLKDYPDLMDKIMFE